MVLALAVGLGLAAAKPAGAQSLTIGVKAGYNTSQVTDITDAAYKGGLTGGGFLSLGIGSFTAVTVEGLYVEKKTDVGGDQFQQNFIEIPVLVSGRFGAGILQPRVYAGIGPSFETTCEVEVSGTTVSTSDCSTEGIDTKTTYWSAAFGAGLDFALPLLVITTDARYNLGLSEISDSTGSAKWNNWMFLVGVGLRIGK